MNNEIGVVDNSELVQPEMPRVLYCNNYLFSVLEEKTGDELFPTSPMEQLLLGVSVEEHYMYNGAHRAGTHELVLRFGEPEKSEDGHFTSISYFKQLCDSEENILFLIQNTDNERKEISRTTYKMLGYVSSFREYSALHKNAMVIAHRFHVVTA